MSQKTNFPANIGTAVKSATRHLGETEGSSFVDIKKYLLSKYQDNGDMSDSKNMRQYLKNAVDTGAILKVLEDNGKYKVKQTARGRRSRSRSRSRGTSKRRSRSRKRSGRRKRSPSGSRKHRRSGSRKRRRSTSGRRRKRSSSGRRRRARKSEKPDEEE